MNNFSLNIDGRLHEFDSPLVMGILNITDDSFYKGSRFSADTATIKAQSMINDGADILDIGGYSSRPGAKDISASEEIERVVPAISMIRNAHPQILISVDTFRADVARKAIHAGADIINDISAWNIDPELLNVVADHNCPYILMHMKGTPENMHKDPAYNNVTIEVMKFLSEKIDILHSRGVNDIIIDPGFGFGKTIDHNYQLLSEFEHFSHLDKPVLAGLSRKSLIYKPLKTSPENSINGTTALNMVALQKGASILRVHDVKEARECIQLFSKLA